MNSSDKKNAPMQQKGNKVSTTPVNLSRLVLWNDDVNSFEYVIEQLVRICKMDEFQAEQIAVLVHFKGSATLKHGEEKFLLPICNRLVKKSLTAEIKK